VSQEVYPENSENFVLRRLNCSDASEINLEKELR